MRNYWVLVLIIFVALAFIGLITDPKAEDTQWRMIGAVIFLASAGFLAYKGQNYINSMRDIAEESYKHIREKDYIDPWL